MILILKHGEENITNRSDRKSVETRMKVNRIQSKQHSFKGHHFSLTQQNAVQTIETTGTLNLKNLDTLDKFILPRQHLWKFFHNNAT